MSVISSLLSSESFRNMVEQVIFWTLLYIAVYSISSAVGVSNTPLLHARKRSIKLKRFIGKLISLYSADKKPALSFSVLYFKKLRKLRAQAKKSVQVYLYDDGRHQSDAEAISSLFKGIDNCTNRAVTALTNEDYEVVIKNLKVIDKLLDNALKSLDSLIKKENKEKLLNFI